MSYILLLSAALAFPILADDAKSEDKNAQNQAAMEALKQAQDLVGDWNGASKGKGGDEGWDEKVNGAWKFDKEGNPSLILKFSADGEKNAKGRILEEIEISHNKKKEGLLAKVRTTDLAKDAEPLLFAGKAKSKTNFVFDRVEKGSAKDSLDRLDLKVLFDGDRVVYSIQKQRGKSKNYSSYAQVALDRKGTSIAGAAATGPKCIVTGGAATMTVSYKGSTYPVCCTGCREVFLADPERFIAKANKKE